MALKSTDGAPLAKSAARNRLVQTEHGGADLTAVCGHLQHKVVVKGVGHAQPGAHVKVQLQQRVVCLAGGAVLVQPALQRLAQAGQGAVQFLGAGFFKKAAFYGGTALRIFYGLDRFSEDLDFSLEAEDLDFDLTAYFPVLEKEVKAFGLNVEIQEKEKTKESTIRSAFLKGNTKEHLLLFYADEKVAGSVAKNEAVKIKFEVDVNPPAFAAFEHKYRLLPVPYEVRLYDMPLCLQGKSMLSSAVHGRAASRAGIFTTMYSIFRGTPQSIKNTFGHD